MCLLVRGSLRRCSPPLLPALLQGPASSRPRPSDSLCTAVGPGLSVHLSSDVDGSPDIEEEKRTGGLLLHTCNSDMDQRSGLSDCSRGMCLPPCIGNGRMGMARQRHQKNCTGGLQLCPLAAHRLKHLHSCNLLKACTMERSPATLALVRSHCSLDHAPPSALSRRCRHRSHRRIAHRPMVLPTPDRLVIRTKELKLPIS